jgi:hypothetical protein
VIETSQLYLGHYLATLEKELIITRKPIGLLGSGRAFSWHEKLAEKLECSTDFAKPYHSSGSVV